MTQENFIILPSFKSKEEKIEEARRSGLLNNKKEVLCCKKCGSLRIQVMTPLIDDAEKGAQLPYTCMDCGYDGIANLKILNIDEKGVLQTELIPQGLVGVVGSFI